MMVHLQEALVLNSLPPERASGNIQVTLHPECADFMKVRSVDRRICVAKKSTQQRAFSDLSTWENMPVNFPHKVTFFFLFLL